MSEKKKLEILASIEEKCMKCMMQASAKCNCDNCPVQRYEDKIRSIQPEDNDVERKEVERR